VTAVHVVVPAGVDDPGRPSGGNVYDRRVSTGLADLGWAVHEVAVPGSWPRPEPRDLFVLAGLLARIPDGAVVLLDGLIASAAPEVLVPEARRLDLVVLVHMPLGDGAAARGETGVAARERAVLACATAVLVTSAWTRAWLVDRYALPPARVHVARPGVDPAEVAPGTCSGQSLLCVATVTRTKGYDVLVAALESLAPLPWRCLVVGSLARDPRFVADLRARVEEAGLAHRIRFSGPLSGTELDTAYAAADALVLASRAETYGMVAVEALARGVPVIATTAGGLPEAVGGDSARRIPGLLVPPGDHVPLASALRRWLGDPDLRHGLREAARHRRAELPGWRDTTARIARVLAEVGT